MRVDDFDFDLPRERIAQVPAAERDAARLLVHDVERDATRHTTFRDLPELLEPGDLVVLNDTRVRPLRLRGRRGSGGRVELLLVERLAAAGTWRARVNPARKLKPGERIVLEDRDGNRAEACGLVMVERGELPDGSLDPAWVVRWDLTEGEPDQWIDRLGHVPLPPYVERAGEELEDLDRERYQTVYARERFPGGEGAVAAPTAGLHFTPELLGRLESRGVRRASVTLHVGEGTFQPVQVERVSEHHMHEESYELPEATVREIEACRQRGGRVIAVGTTSVRVLESCATSTGALRPGTGRTSLFLFPGRPVRVVDGLLTNFHLPRSTLLMLVSTLAGRERILRLYREAIERSYRFFSYGDAMLLFSGRGQRRT